MQYTSLRVRPARRRSAGRPALWWVALCALAPLSRAQGVGGEPRPDGFTAGGNEVHYDIRASLDDDKRLEASETISWTNRSGEPVSDLWFHLYLNAFSNNRSSHLTESGGKLRRHSIQEGWGWSRVRSVRRVYPTESVDLFDSFRYRQPDDGREEDRTVFSVDLDQPVGPGETVELEVEWSSQLPRVRRRTGHKDDFLLVAQWFPKLGVYEGNRGWNCHQFHMNTEWYSDYGTYDVTLDLPVRYRDKVFGSGIVESSVVRGERVEVVFAAPSKADRRRPDKLGELPVVHDFTWTADPRYEVKSYLFEYEAWAQRFPEEVALAQSAFGPAADLELRDVRITVLIHPERVEQAERHREATEAALFFYGLWFGEYPYEHIAVVDPPWGGRAAGGMEYPGIFTCGTSLFTTEDMHSPESVTIHEAGHQFWYGLVGNNEFESAWLDEGFNSYTDSEVLVRRYGPERRVTRYGALPFDGVPRVPVPGGRQVAEILAGREIPLPFVENITPLGSSDFVDWWRDQPVLSFSPERRDPRWYDRTRYLSNPDTDPLDTFGWLHADRPSYSTNSYPRTAVALRTLRDLVGVEPFLRGMRHYAAKYRYAHPYPEDFYAAFQEGSGVDDLDWFFEDFFQGTGTGDWSIGVDQKRRARPTGFFQGGSGEFVEIEKPEEESESTDDEEDETRPWACDVVVRRQGTLRVPVTVRLTFESGATEEFVWTREEQAEKRWLRRAFETADKLVAAELDPERKVWVDTKLANNQWFDEKDRVAPLRWSERVLARWTNLLHWYAGVGG